jgi:hypothetical protein
VGNKTHSKNPQQPPPLTREADIPHNTLWRK